MNKRVLYLLLGLVAVCSVGGYIGYRYINRCQQPPGIRVLVAQLTCGQSIDRKAFVEELCQQLHGTPDCQIVEADREAGKALFVKKLNQCAREALESGNYCTDQYSDIQ